VRTIWKYPLHIIDRQMILLPDGGMIRHVAMQHDIPCLWVEVDTEAPKTERFIRIFGTGHPHVSGEYIGSFQALPGTQVFHVYEER
jgi:hypothetical protein